MPYYLCEKEASADDYGSRMVVSMVFQIGGDQRRYDWVCSPREVGNVDLHGIAPKRDVARTTTAGICLGETDSQHRILSALFWKSEDLSQAILWYFL